MKLFTTLFLLFVFRLSFAQSPAFAWAKLYGGTTSSAQPNKVVIGADSSIYVSGYFMGPGPCNFELNTGLTELVTSGGDPDMYITRHNKSGDLIWVKHFDGAGSSTVWGMSIDSLDNIYVSGNFWGTIDFDPSPGVTNLTAIGTQDNYILKIDSTGNLIWVYTSVDGVTGWNCSIDNDGYLYVFGTVNGIVDCDFGPGVFNTTGQVLLKCDLDGNLIWANNYGNINISQVTANSSGNIVMCGIYFGPFQDFDGKAGVYNVAIQGAAGDIFVSTMDQNGNLIWVGAMGGTLTESVFMQIDVFDNIYLHSRLSNGTDFDWGVGTLSLPPVANFDNYISKYNSNGDHLWTKQLTGSGNEDPEAIKIDVLGNLYVTGTFELTTDFDPSLSDYEMICSGLFCTYLAKYDEDGNFIWVRQFGDDTDDKFTDMTFDSSDSLIIVGTYMGSHDLNLGAGNYNVNSGTFSHSMLMKYGECTLSSDSIVNIVVCDSYTLNGQTYNSTGTYVQQISGYNGCDSTIILELVVDPGSTQPVSTITQNLTLLSLSAAGTNYQWLDCDDAFSPVAGMNSTNFSAPGTGSFAVMIDSAGCIDTSSCYVITAADFYNTPGYTTLTAEVFPFPVSDFSDCNAEALAFVNGGIQPYDIVWSHDPGLTNQFSATDICYGFYTYKVFDNIGDSLIVPYFITDSINYYDWYNPGTETDTLYLNTENCLLNYNLPIDSVELITFSYIGPNLSGTGDLYLTGINYYQTGTSYYYEDTLNVTTGGNQLIVYAFWCPAKSNSTIKILKHLIKFPAVLGTENINKNNLFLFPNPTSGKINFSHEIDGFDLYDISGKIIVTCNEKTQTLDISFLNSGVYFMRVRNQGGGSPEFKVFLISE